MDFVRKLKQIKSGLLTELSDRGCDEERLFILESTIASLSNFNDAIASIIINGDVDLLNHILKIYGLYRVDLLKGIDESEFISAISLNLMDSELIVTSEYIDYSKLSLDRKRFYEIILIITGV